MRLITRFDVSPGPENVKAVFAFTPDSVPEKFHTKIFPLQWGETAERMPFGEPVFFPGNPAKHGKKLPNSNPSAIGKQLQMHCIADKAALHRSVKRRMMQSRRNNPKGLLNAQSLRLSLAPTGGEFFSDAAPCWSHVLRLQPKKKSV